MELSQNHDDDVSEENFKENSKIYKWFSNCSLQYFFQLIDY